MKKLSLILLTFCLFPLCALCAHAEEVTGAEGYYAEAFSAIDDDTKDLLSSVGISPTDLASLMSLSPESLLDLLRELFGTEASSKAKLLGECIALMLLIRFFGTFLSSPAVKDACEQVGGMALVFLIVSGSAAVADSCVRAVTLTKNCMLTLIPVLGTVVAFSGHPAGAAAVHAVVFSFAQGVSVLFADLVAPLAAVGAALSCAAAISPMPGVEQLSALINKLAVWIAAFVSGVFAAVLGVRGVVSGAADSVTAKGVRFLMAGVPVVGSALGEALSSLTASLALVKNGVAILGVLAVVFICLPGVCSLLVWKAMLHLVSLSAQLLEIRRIPAFVSSFNAVFNVLLAVVLFNVFVYIVALAVVAAVKAM